MTSVPDEHYAQCETLLRARDRDLWLASLFAPQEARPHIHAIYAFAQEAADAPAKVTQPILGEMRLRWWADAIEAHETQGEGARAHPVADALIDTIERFVLPRAELVALADAHIADLYDDPLPTLAALEDYCRATAAGPMRWAARILGADPDATSARAFDDAGVALGLTRMLRAAPRELARFTPTELLARHGARREEFEGTRLGAELRAALAELRALAQRRYVAARKAAGSLGDARAALLPAATIPLYLERMARKDYDPFRPFADPSPLRRQWRLWRAARGVGL
ncbi:squalene/phytoene synthase family protein [Methylocystis sp. 9N]|uniref:Squalene/phytoene synthase family protein n=1 Tax=Methylocystis borbori TaxID=3118750 RepID=A0ABU7XIA7_9HYPH